VESKLSKKSPVLSLYPSLNRTEINKITSAMGKVIDTKDLEYAIEFHLSNEIKWHTDRNVTLHPEYEFAFFKKE